MKNNPLPVPQDPIESPALQVQKLDLHWSKADFENEKDKQREEQQVSLYNIFLVSIISQEATRKTLCVLLLFRHVSCWFYFGHNSLEFALQLNVDERNEE